VKIVSNLQFRSAVPSAGSQLFVILHDGVNWRNVSIINCFLCACIWPWPGDTIKRTFWVHRPSMKGQGRWPDPGDRPPLIDWHRLPRLMTSWEGQSNCWEHEDSCRSICTQSCHVTNQLEFWSGAVPIFARTRQSPLTLAAVQCARLRERGSTRCWCNIDYPAGPRIRKQDPWELEGHGQYVPPRLPPPQASRMLRMAYRMLRYCIRRRRVIS
jgi:hypothetical protein